MTVGTHEAISWETSLPLFSARMLRQWTAVLLITGLVMMVLLGTAFVVTGERDALVPMALMVAAVDGGIWLLGLVIMAVVFRGSWRVRYTVSDRGIRCETVDRVARTANRVAVAAGVLAGSPQAVGAGLIGASRETEEARWSGAFRVSADERGHCLTLRNSWRTVMWVQCTPGNFAAVSKAVAEQMAAHRTETRASGRSPIPRALARTGLVIVAVLPLLAAADEFGTGLLVPIITLCFGLASVWLVNLFGWVVLGSLAVQAALTLARQLEQRPSYFRHGETYRAYEVLNGSDLSLLLLAALGATVLAWLVIRGLRGRWLAVLIDDGQSMSG